MATRRPSARHRTATPAGRRRRLLATFGALGVLLFAGAQPASGAWSGLPPQALGAVATPEEASGERSSDPIRERVWDPAAGAWGVWEWQEGSRSWRLVDIVRPGDGPSDAGRDAEPRSTDDVLAADTGEVDATSDAAAPDGRRHRSVPRGAPTPVATPYPGGGAATPAGFVGRRGGEFVVAGEPLRATGVNLFDAAGGPGWSCEYASSEEELTTAFRELHDAGARVVRFWAYQSYTDGGTDWRGIDKVIGAAKATGMLLIPTLEDGPGYCTTGPTEQAKWQVDGYFTEGYKRPYGSAKLSLLDYARTIAEHYRDEPTIAAWMIMNEAETSERSADGKSALVGMAREVAGAIKSVDPNHLVSLGTQGNGAAGTSGPDFADIYSLPELDYAEVHDWPAEGGSETAVLAGRADDGALPDADGAQCRAQNAPLACSFAIARKLGKPLVVGEVGVKRQNAGGQEKRAEVMGAKVRAHFEAGASLVLLWEARLPGDGGGEGYEVRPGSGDPMLAVLAGSATGDAGRPADAAEGGDRP